MTLRDQIEIDRDSIPYSFDLDIEEVSFTFGIKYNDVSGLFSVSLSTIDGTKIVDDDPLILNQPLFYGRTDPKLPVWSIVPMDESGQETEITWDNFGTSVLLLIDDLGGDEDGDQNN